jgi:hypothetical protein
MAGVAGPMLRESRRDGIRFLLGLSAGAVAGGLMISLVALVAGTLATSAVGTQPRLLLLAALCVAMGAADLTNRTPHVWRQVPQALARALPPGSLGTTWGFDIGLLFTTQKVASLIWAALAAAVLIEPIAAPVLLVGVAILMSGTIAVRSTIDDGGVLAHGSRRDRQWTRSLRAASGAGLLVLAATTAIQALHI